MRTRCPACGATLSLDALIAHEGAREALAALVALGGPLAQAVIRYLGLFRPDSRELTFDRLARLLGELLPDLRAQRIERNRQVFEAPPEAWLWAIEQTLSARDEGRLKTPLKSHGWLYEVLSGWRGAGAGTSVVNAAAPRPVAGSRTAAALAALREDAP
jgi:hypothetical protein